VSYAADRGGLAEARLEGDFFTKGDISLWESSLVGCCLEREALAHRLQATGDVLFGITIEDILSMFFM